MSKFKTYRLIISCLAFLFLGKLSVAQYSEYEIQAAYIFNFAKFIEWPVDVYSQSDTIVLGVYKNDPFGITLEKTMIGRKANGKSWKILRLQKMSDVDKCHIIYFSEIDKFELGLVLKRIQNKPILSIGDEIESFCEIGGIVNFTAQFSHNQFEINNKLAIQHGIKINPKLLKLAKIVSYNEDEF